MFYRVYNQNNLYGPRIGIDVGQPISPAAPAQKQETQGKSDIFNVIENNHVNLNKGD